MLDKIQAFTFLFLMLGPFKIIGPFAKITRGADAKFIRQIAFRSILFSSIALLMAAFLGQTIMSKYGIPLPILGISGGIILFLIALLNIINQFSINPESEERAITPTMKMAINPLAFPTIVTPYGIALVIIMMSMFPDQKSKLTIGLIVLGIMALNLIIMLITRHILKYLAVILALVGAILGIIQVAFGLLIIYNQFRNLLAL
jgi:multiple antibiotic resistance protein